MCLRCWRATSCISYTTATPQNPQKCRAPHVWAPSAGTGVWFLYFNASNSRRFRNFETEDAHWLKSWFHPNVRIPNTGIKSWHCIPVCTGYILRSIAYLRIDSSPWRMNIQLPVGILLVLKKGGLSRIWVILQAQGLWSYHHRNGNDIGLLNDINYLNKSNKLNIINDIIKWLSIWSM